MLGVVRGVSVLWDIRCVYAVDLVPFSLYSCLFFPTAVRSLFLSSPRFHDALLSFHTSVKDNTDTMITSNSTFAEKQTRIVLWGINLKIRNLSRRIVSVRMRIMNGMYHIIFAPVFLLLYLLLCPFPCHSSSPSLSINTATASIISNTIPATTISSSQKENV